MNVLFLDVDGVLNDDKCLKNSWRLGTSTNAISREYMDRLAEIVHQSWARVVLSSDWRLHTNRPADSIIRAVLSMWNIRMIGRTPDLIKAQHRSEEIRHWLDNTKENVRNFVILDDMEEAGFGMEDNFVHVKDGQGLREEHVKRAIDILNK